MGVEQLRKNSLLGRQTQAHLAMQRIANELAFPKNDHQTKTHGISSATGAAPL
jgi:hypothetical protein